MVMSCIWIGTSSSVLESQVQQGELWLAVESVAYSIVHDKILSTIGDVHREKETALQGAFTTTVLLIALI